MPAPVVAVEIEAEGAAEIEPVEPVGEILFITGLHSVAGFVWPSEVSESIVADAGDGVTAAIGEGNG